MADRHPEKICLIKHGTNTTLAYHECMCNYDYSFSRGGKIKSLKIRHCHEVADMYKIGSFYSYLLVIAAIFLGIIILIAALCSCKWYFKTKKNPCKCFSIFCCCHPRRRIKEHVIDLPVDIYEEHETGHMWSPVSLPPQLPPMQEEQLANGPNNVTDASGSCMSFCLSDPVQDCCEFFDCDIMWRKKSVYTIPIFGRKKHLQRRPSRPAPAPPPPPPKAIVLPQLKPFDPNAIEPFDPTAIDEFECEPVPEAPPSPEPIRTLPAKALYVDPLSFLQRPFLKMSSDKAEDETDNKEALYVKFKNLVLSKVKKSSSTASINKMGVSTNPDGSSQSSLSHLEKKKKTASLASLHNLDEVELDTCYGSKRSLSLASLHMFQQECDIVDNVPNDPRSRISVISSATADDIPPSARKDEYIDLAEMSKRIAAKMRANQNTASHHQMPIQQEHSAKVAVNSSYTPDFMPASAFSPTPSSFNPNQTSLSDSSFRLPLNESAQEVILHPGQYYPPIPASQGRPAVPARTSIVTPIYSMSPSVIVERQKPAVPPRPPNIDSSFSRSSILTRSPRPVRPTGPPPPPPGSRPPIESSI